MRHLETMNTLAFTVILAGLYLVSFQMVSAEGIQEAVLVPNRRVLNRDPISLESRIGLIARMALGGWPKNSIFTTWNRRKRKR